jgi:quercetin dioxygenase-like cupin family protein
MEISRKRKDTKAMPADRFTGQVWMDEIGSTERTMVASVHFSPGARTAWHMHPNGQVLHVIEGAGLTQSRGAGVEEIRAGDAVAAEPGEWHWHGAGPATFMTHIAVSEGVTEWADPVTDEEYNS